MNSSMGYVNVTGGRYDGVYNVPATTTHHTGALAVHRSLRAVLIHVIVEMGTRVDKQRTNNATESLRDPRLDLQPTTTRLRGAIVAHSVGRQRIGANTHRL